MFDQIKSVKTIIALLTLVCLPACLFAKDVYVSPSGSNYYNGTINSPYATIQFAVNKLDPGETCYIRGGTYHEEVVIDSLNGTAENPITFTNYEDEVVTMDGTIPITTGWTLHSGNIYKTTLTQDIWQLFVDGEMMIMARWPNLPAGMDLWDQDQELSWAHGNEAMSLVNTVEYDSPYGNTSLAGCAIDMSGAMAILNIGSFKTWAREVTNHNAGSAGFSYNDIPASGYRDKHHYYYMECKLELLDAENEWFYDSSDKTLYLWAPGGNVPTGDIGGKTITYAFDVTNSHYVVIDGLDFFATTFSFNTSSNCTVKNCDLQYPSCSKRMLKNAANIEYSRMYASNNGAKGNTVYNCIFENTDGMALGMRGAGNVIENNYFHNIDYTCANLPGLGVSVMVDGGSGAIIRRNTIDTTATSSAISPANTATNEYNRITNTGMLQSDGSCIHYMVGPARNSITRYNWIHDTPKYTIRFDNSIGEYGLVHHNLVFNAGCMRLKGDWHQTYNNTGFDFSNWKGNINIATEGGNLNSITRNNVASLITMYPIPGTESNNYSAEHEELTMRELLRDADNYDFRPKSDSLLVDTGYDVAGITDGYDGAAPDIGAYEHNAFHYWIAGRKWPHASTPVPPDNATNVKLDADLMWLEGLDAFSHNVYFGTDPCELTPYGSFGSNIFTPPSLDEFTTYYWRVDAVTAEADVTDDDIVTGRLWSFMTEGTKPEPIIRKVTVVAVEDAFVDVNSPDSNFGSSLIIDLKTPEPDFIKEQGYIKFEIPEFAGTLTRAVLRLHTSRASPLQAGAEVYRVFDNSWSEDTITWNNQPGIDGSFIAYIYVAALSWADCDISDYITSSGAYSLGLIRGVSVSNRSVDSTESDFAPEVVLTYEVSELTPDIDGNGKVDFADFAIISKNWMNQCDYPDWCECADLDVNGTVSFNDLVLFAQSWLK